MELFIDVREDIRPGPYTPPGMKRPRVDRALPIGVIVLVLVTVVVTRLPHLGTGPLDFDEGVYWLSMRSMRAGNPLFASVYSSQPPAFLLLSEPVWNWLGGSIAAGRAVMVGWAVLGVGSGAILGWRLAGPLAGVVVAVALAVDPRMVNQSIILQADGPAVSLGLLSLAAAAVAVTVHRPRWRALGCALAGAALALGILTKLFDAGLVPVLVVILLSDRRRWHAMALAAGGALAVTAAVLLPVAGSLTSMWNEAVGLHLNTHSLYPGITFVFLRSFVHTEWPAVVAGAIGFAVGWRRTPRAWVVGVAWCAGALLALAATRPIFPHHMALLIPGLALLGATGLVGIVAECRDRLGDRGLAAAGGVSVVVALAAALLLLDHALTLLTTPTDLALVSRLQALTAPTALVIGDDQFDQALAARDAPPPFVDTSIVRLRGGGVSATTIESVLLSEPRACAVLFDTGRLAGVPGFVAWVATEYPARSSLPGGAVLYTRPNCPG